MFTFMITGEPSGNREQASRRVIIVGVDDSAEAEAAARWAVREAELRKTDVLLVHAYDVPILGPKRRAAAIAHGRQDRQALLDTARAFCWLGCLKTPNSPCSAKIIQPSMGA